MQTLALIFSFRFGLGKKGYAIQEFSCEARSERLRLLSTVCNKVFQSIYELGKIWDLKLKHIFFSAFLLTRRTILSCQVLLDKRNLRFLFAF